MMDPTSLYPNSYHPIKTDRNRNFTGEARHFTRTQMPPKYYFVDFGISRRYDIGAVPLEPVIRGGDKSVPEHRTGDPCNPFPTDVYYVGNMIRQEFLKVSNLPWHIVPCFIPFQRKRNFDFMAPLVNKMVAEDPNSRPTMGVVVTTFAETKKLLGPRTLAARVADRNEFFPFSIARDIFHLGKHIFSGGNHMRRIDTGKAKSKLSATS
jgi:hypothetical protein